MRTNVAERPAPIFTHEGAKAARIGAIAQLRRSVMACMLFENTFYEDGVAIAERIAQETAAVLAMKDGASIVANIAYEARTAFKLRHAPLWLICNMIQSKDKDAKRVIAGAIMHIVQRPDELAELVAMYWKGGKFPLPRQMKLGLAEAMKKFDEYSLSKYANAEGKVSIRDVMFLCHPKPKDEAQADLWRRLAGKELKQFDTWESQLSAGQDKGKVFEGLLDEKKLGPLALLRNLRNMREAGVPETKVREAILTMKTERVLPFRFISAAKHAPAMEPYLEQAMFRCLADAPKLMGKTALLVDNSGSMYWEGVSKKSDIFRIDAAAALAILLREICEHVDVVSFSGNAVMVPPRRGFALRDAIRAAPGAQGGTMTANALQASEKLGYDRCIVLTDEQSHQTIRPPLPGKRGYFVNVATNQNGIGYGPWLHVDGFSEAIVDFIIQSETE